MRVFDGSHPLDECRRCVVAIGNFDGVHRGHQAMLARLNEHAHVHQTRSAVLTFEPHPVTLLRPKQVPPQLSTLSQKLELFERYGVECAIVYPTDVALLEQSPRQFFETIVQQKLEAVGLVEGPNFYFGKNRAGNVSQLAEFCQQAGLFLDVVEPTRTGGEMISSSRIRQLIQEGNLRSACELLGHPYQLEGTVGRGEQRGAGLGFPTANLSDIETLIPAEGVYAGFALYDRRGYPAAILVGTNPTFRDQNQKVEVHLIGFEGDLYGTKLKVDFLERIRDVRKFDSAKALQEQLQRDVMQVKSLVSETSRR
jgi:riboflavin kinase/FMN adenylyltransferase